MERSGCLIFWVTRRTSMLERQKRHSPLILGKGPELNSLGLNRHVTVEAYSKKRNKQTMQMFNYRLWINQYDE